MALTETSVTRSVDETGDEIKTFTDSDGRHVQVTGLSDESGDHAGIPSNPLYVDSGPMLSTLETMCDTLKKIEFQLSLITGFPGE